MWRFFRSSKSAASVPTALRGWKGRHVTTLPRSTPGTGLATTSAGMPPVLAGHAKGGSPQFPGLDFQERGIEFDDRASNNDAAIRASLIYFKHRWPGRPAVLEGSEAFKLRVWELAQEHGVAVKGPHPLAGNLPVRFGSQHAAHVTSSPALASPSRRRLSGPR